MAFSDQLATTPSYADFPFFNYSGTDIAAGLVVVVDPTNTFDAASTNEGVGVAPVAVTGDPAIGVTLEVIKAGSYGRVRCGGIAACLSDGAITAGTWVDGSAAATKVGNVKAHTGAKSAIGIALNGATADNTQVLVLLAPCINA